MHQGITHRPGRTTHPAIAAAAAIILLDPRRLHQHDRHQHRGRPGVGGGRGQHRAGRAPAHPHRVRVDVRRAVLLRGLRPVPAAAPGRDHRLRRRGQQRGHRRVQRPAGQLRRLRRAHDRPRASSRQGRPGHPGARRPRRRRHRLQPVPAGRRPAAPDRPGPGGHLPRADHPLERPGHDRPQPRHHPPPAPITVVHRSDGSGTTYIFSNYLSSVDPAWAAKVGTGKTLNWPAGRRRRRQRRGGLRGVPHSVVHRIHRAGLFPGPAPAVRRHPQPGRELRHPVRPDRRRRRRPETRHHPGRLLHRQRARRQQLPDQRVQLGADLHPSDQTRPPDRLWSPCWTGLPTQGQAAAAATSYVPLPSQIQQLARTMLQQITGPAGTRLLS